MVNKKMQSCLKNIYLKIYLSWVTLIYLDLYQNIYHNALISAFLTKLPKTKVSKELEPQSETTCDKGGKNIQ